MAYQKNDILTVSIEDMSTEGEGIGKVDGFTLFIKDAVIGDTVHAKVIKSKPHYAYARLEKVIIPSPFRVEPECAYHRQCGGCQIQALSYEKQLEFKQTKIRNNLVRIGGFEGDFVDSIMEPIVGMDRPYHYRNKAQYPVGRDKTGHIITGFYAGRTHTIIPNTNCLLGAEENSGILETILEYMKENNVSAYDETTGKGLVRHILIRTGFTGGQIMVCLVINYTDKAPGRNRRNMNRICVELGEEGKNAPEEQASSSLKKEYLPAQQELIDKLKQIPGMTSISVSINTQRTNVIMGTTIHTLWGSDRIQDTIHVRDMNTEGYPVTGQQLTFHISPLSFYQVNPVQTEKLYSLALEYAGLTGRETVWDLYCGIGTISLFLAQKAGKVYGVEIIPQAIADARENAEYNHVENVTFFVGKAEEVLPEFYEKGSVNGEAVTGAEGADMQHPDVIVVDPPRKGCDEACLNTMLQMQPERIVYVSCDSATLARDLRILCDGGYELRKVRGVDQFGHTTHVECVIMMQYCGKEKKK